MAHYCIANPCWICYPEYAPKSNENNYEFWQQTIQEHHIPKFGLSGIVKNAIIEIFKAGLSEDAHYWAIRGNVKFSSDMLLEEMKNLKDGMFEAELLNLLIEEFKNDEEREKLNK